MPHSYQPLQGKTSREAVNATAEEPDTSSEDILANATFNDRRRRNWYYRLVLDWWLWEIGACALSLLALATTIAVLVVYSEKNVPELPEYITLNAIISVLTNAIKMPVLGVIAACISQLKWLWLKDMRRVEDLQIFDDASRGPLGSLNMLSHLRGCHLASLGEVVTILTVALEPFMQQLVIYPVRLVYRESGKASTLRADNVSYAAQGWLEIDYSSLTNTTPISRAMECMFTYCLQRYNVSVESGVSTIKTDPVHLASMNQLSGWNVTAPLLPDKDKEGTTTFVVDDIAGHSLWKRLILNLVGNATTWVQSTEYFIPSNTFIGTSRTVDDKVHMMESIA
ncbi:hypothetical protein I7I51_00712 [Histoplasma capsulatum]|uniref:Uncharacterized protein n=1 Tax=Ajellomyces capsulatus TaxID=5037 RepID=A0A8A1MG67_AJECA|nr:hypothetical protein I7I51_00712 [Histoplasma capsulatum]